VPSPAVLVARVIRLVSLASALPTAPAASPARLAIDHVSFCGSALAPMERAFGEAGLPTEYGGPSASAGTHVAAVGFADGSSIELIAPQKSGVRLDRSPWRKAIAGEAGPCAWAVPVADLDREIARLRALGIRTEKPEPGDWTRPNGAAATWRSAAIGPRPPGSTLPLLIERSGKGRVAPTPGAPPEVAGIRAVVLAVRRLDPAIALLRRAYGWGPPEIGTDAFFGATLASFPGQPVVLAAPLRTSGSWLAFRRKRFGDGPAAVVLEVRNLDAAAKRFDLAGETRWFGKRVLWFRSTRLRGARVGMTAP